MAVRLVEALNERILIWFSWLDALQLDCAESLVQIFGGLGQKPQALLFYSYESGARQFVSCAQCTAIVIGNYFLQRPADFRAIANHLDLGIG